MLGANIRDRRIKLGMTQEKFANLIGCSQSNVSKYENEDLGIDATMIPRITRALGCTIDDLYQDNTEQKGA